MTTKLNSNKLTITYRRRTIRGRSLNTTVYPGALRQHMIRDLVLYHNASYPTHFKVPRTRVNVNTLNGATLTQMRTGRTHQILTRRTTRVLKTRLTLGTHNGHSKAVFRTKPTIKGHTRVITPTILLPIRIGTTVVNHGHVSLTNRGHLT